MDADPRVQPIADYRGHPWSQVEPVHGSAAPQAQDQVVVAVVAWKKRMEKKSQSVQRRHANEGVPARIINKTHVKILWCY